MRKSKKQKKWWLCNATDFQSLMYPCFIYCRILGIFPYKFNASTFEISKLRYILSTVVICVCCFVNWAVIYSIFTKRITFGIPRNIHTCVYYMLSCLMVITTHILSGRQMRLLQILLKISSKLPPKTYQQLSRLIHVKDILGIILTIVQLIINFHKLPKMELDFFVVLIGASSIYFAFIVLQIIMLYVNCVCILKACFKRINDNLVDMQRLVINDVKPSVPRLICHVQKNELLLIELKALKRMHLMVSDAVQMLNNLFSPQLLATITLAISVITFESYFYVVRWQDGAFITFDIHFLDVLLVSVAHTIMKISLLLWACETGKNQAKEIGTTIHDLLNCGKDEKIKYELQLFSLQILQRKNTFSAKGLDIDAAFGTVMVGNITTYIIILIQFLNMSHSCDRNTGITYFT